MSTFTNIFSRASGPTNSKSQTIDILQILKDPGAVLYGSRALGVNHQKSDYDIALSYESHKHIYSWLLSANIVAITNIDYFTSVPEAGYHTFFQYYANDFKTDIIFVHNDEDLDVISSSVRDLQSIPAYMLAHKTFRIEAYNRALQHRGWKPAILTANLTRDDRVRRAAPQQQFPTEFFRRQVELERGTTSQLDFHRALFESVNTSPSLRSSEIWQ